MEEKQGKIASVGMPRLLHLIYRKGDSTAVLDIVREPVKKRFFFKDGLPVAATSNILNEVLGRLLMQEGVISQKDYENSLQTVLKEKKKHGEVLISMGLITPEQLDTFLALQLKRRVWKIFGWNDGVFRYSKADAAPPASKAPVHPAVLILDGINLGFYPSARLTADLKPYLDEPLQPVESPEGYRLDDFRLNLQEKRFLSAFEGGKTLREVLAGSDLLRHRALSLALSFIISGFLKARNAAEADELDFFAPGAQNKAGETGGEERLNAELLFMRAKSALADEDYPFALKTLKEITDLNPAEGEYWAYLGWATYKENPDEIDAAKKIIKDALDLNNDLDNAWYFLGMLSLASGDAQMAEQALRTAVSKNPWLLEAAAELKRMDIKRSMPEIPAKTRACLEVLGLEEDPFTSAPDSRYLLNTDNLSKALDFLVKAVKKKSGPALVTGPEGSGKTTLIIELLKRLSNEKVLCATLLRPPERELDLMKEINREVESPTEAASIKEQLLNLGMRVSQNKIQGGQAVIIIDQAHLLTPGAIKLVQYLSRLKTLQILLFAEHALATRLKDPDFRELDSRLTQRFTLRPMSAEETGAYVLKRVNEVEKGGSSSLLESALDAAERKRIFEESKGVPGDVNHAGARALERFSVHGSPPAPEKEPEELESLVPPRIFPENEMDVDRAKQELELEASEDSQAKYAPFSHDTGSAPGAAATPGLKAETPGGAHPQGVEQSPQKSSAFVKAIIWVFIVIVAAIVAGVLTGLLDIGGLLKSHRAAPPKKIEAPAPAQETAPAPQATKAPDTATPLPPPAPAPGSAPEAERPAPPAGAQ